VTLGIIRGLYPGFSLSCPLRFSATPFPTSAISQAARGFTALRAPVWFCSEGYEAYHDTVAAGED